MTKRFEEKDIEAVLQRLDRLTQDEARIAGAEILKVVHGLVQKMNVLIDGEKCAQLVIHHLLNIFLPRWQVICR